MELEMAWPSVNIFDLWSIACGSEPATRTVPWIIKLRFTKNIAPTNLTWTVATLSWTQIDDFLNFDQNKNWSDIFILTIKKYIYIRGINKGRTSYFGYTLVVAFKQRANCPAVETEMAAFVHIYNDYI